MISLQGINPISIQRNNNGIPHISCSNNHDFVMALGYCHAMDRGIQMMMFKTLGQGNAARDFEGSEEMIAIDRFFRRMNWKNVSQQSIDLLTTEEKEIVQAYCDGINTYFAKKQPWELKWLTAVKDFHWTIADVVTSARMMGYLTLAQSQGEIQQILLEWIQQGLSEKHIRELLPHIKEDINIELLQAIILEEKIVPDHVKWNPYVKPMMASNNWVVAGNRSKSGMPLLSNDPHLETNRIPNVWYEITAKVGTKEFAGATVPGIFALLLGRNQQLAWGATYTFLDSVDFWIEKCRPNQFFKDGKWHDFQQRHETITIKNGSPQQITFYENDHGVLLGSPNQEGYYLSMNWSGYQSDMTAIKNAIKILDATTVKHGMECLGELEVSFNWVLADDQGNIGYQMSGRSPIRPHQRSGLFPHIGWDRQYDWQGFLPTHEMPRRFNPPEGFIITANNNLNNWCNHHPINMPMGDYRAKRIEQLIRAQSTHHVESFQQMHFDVYSVQAEKMMEIIRPLLPHNDYGLALQQWDYCYDINSKGAYLFERIYRALYSAVFGPWMGKDWLDFLQHQTGIFIDFYANFDNILLKESSIWFGEYTREQLYQQAIQKALSGPIRKWGEQNKIAMNNILLGGKLPAFLGFDKGEYAIPGGRATVQQGQVYQSNGRATSFTPSYRFIADMGSTGIYSNMAGGASDRRFSKWYFNDFENWQKGKYKKLG